MPVSKLDQIYRSILLTKFFTKGWGNSHNIKRLFEFRDNVLQREKCFPLVSNSHPVHIDKEEEHSDCRILEGHFTSPFAQHLPGVVPKESETAYFQLILPRQWKSSLKPICLHLAGTGDHFFWRRRAMLARPLLKEMGIGSIILENPLYTWMTLKTTSKVILDIIGFAVVDFLCMYYFLHGLRKPRDQVRSSLHNVSDIFVMGGCLALESIALFHWCEKQGFGPLGVTGISMGGHMASIAAGVWPKPLALIPCLSWTTASCVFTQGVMSGAIPWHLLQNQYFSDEVYHELREKISTLTDDDTFRAGKQFAKTYPAGLAVMNEIGSDEERTSEQQAHLRQQSISHQCEKSTSSVGKSSNETNRSSKPSVQSCNLADESGSTSSSKQMSNAWRPVLPKLNLRTSSSSVVGKASKEEALQFMRGIMDEFTHLANFSRPIDPSLVIVVAAKDDAYVLREGITDLTELWPGAEVRYIASGHIAAFLFNQSVFRKAIGDAFKKMEDKYCRKPAMPVQHPATQTSEKRVAQDI